MWMPTSCGKRHDRAGSSPPNHPATVKCDVDALFRFAGTAPETPTKGVSSKVLPGERTGSIFWTPAVMVSSRLFSNVGSRASPETVAAMPDTADMTATPGSPCSTDGRLQRRRWFDPALIRLVRGELDKPRRCLEVKALPTASYGERESILACISENSRCVPQVVGAPGMKDSYTP